MGKCKRDTDLLALLSDAVEFWVKCDWIQLANLTNGLTHERGDDAVSVVAPKDPLKGIWEQQKEQHMPELPRVRFG